MADGLVPADAMRLDRFLWFARLARNRDGAQAIAEQGRLRINGRPVDRAHTPVRIGNVLTFASHGRVLVIRVTGLPARRGPAAEARCCYQELGADPGLARPENVSQATAHD